MSLAERGGLSPFRRPGGVLSAEQMVRQDGIVGQHKYPMFSLPPGTMEFMGKSGPFPCSCCPAGRRFRNMSRRRRVACTNHLTPESGENRDTIAQGLPWPMESQASPVHDCGARVAWKPLSTYSRVFWR